MTSPMRVLITGSRTWESDTTTADGHTLHDVLDTTALVAAEAGFLGLLVVHGGANGADLLADEWVRSRKRRGWPVSVERHPADWGMYGRRAGFVRNAHMVKLGADLVLAFILNGSRGATGCADLAEGAGIHVQRFAVSTAEPIPDFDSIDAA